MDISLIKLKQAIDHFFRRYHVMTFMLTAVIGVSLAVLSLYNIVLQSGNPTEDQVNAASNSSFDNDTIDQLNLLLQADSSEKYTLPKDQRTNPFIEN
ncbi:MAG: hypothetical protein WBB94_04220 [Candidatus Saccharimonadaceae bacterium]